MCSSFAIENKYAPCISDNAELRVIMSVLYTIIEVIRCYDVDINGTRIKSSNNDYTAKYKVIKEQLRSELSINDINSAILANKSSIIVIL